MPWLPQPPQYRTADENLMASMRASDIDRANRSTEDGDELRDESPSVGHRNWLFVVLAILGIVGLFILLSALLGLL